MEFDRGSGGGDLFDARPEMRTEPDLPSLDQLARVLDIVDEISLVLGEQLLELGDARLDIVGRSAEHRIDGVEDLVADRPSSRQGTRPCPYRRGSKDRTTNW
jgi:hypothetical protein